MLNLWHRMMYAVCGGILLEAKLNKAKTQRRVSLKTFAIMQACVQRQTEMEEED